MADRQLDRCQTCNAAILWAKSEKSGKAVPLDPDPTPDGNIQFVGEKEEGVVHFLTKVEKAGEATRYRYVSHYATCKNSKEWRKGAVRRAADRAIAKVREGL